MTLQAELYPFGIEYSYSAEEGDAVWNQGWYIGCLTSLAFLVKQMEPLATSLICGHAKLRRRVRKPGRYQVDQIVQSCDLFTSAAHSG